MVHRTPSLLPHLFPKLLWRMPAEKKELYLTFDDGPIPQVTEFVLEELSKQKIKATFFCIGDNVRKHPEIFKRIVNEGHTVGNHTFNHLKGWQTDSAVYLDNIEQCDREVIAHCSLTSVKYFRPPYGRITPKQIKSIPDKRIVMWDVLSRDYDGTLAKENCLKGSLQAVRNGSIIVFHDSLKAERNLRYALPPFLDTCLREGYTFKPLA
jgi:peptidoglycan/xylan/chitin deacetylase (PgdA/CDA1 family)